MEESNFKGDYFESGLFGYVLKAVKSVVELAFLLFVENDGCEKNAKNCHAV